VGELLPFLKPGGLVIMTLKNRGNGRDRSFTVSKLEAFFKVRNLAVWKRPVLMGAAPWNQSM